MRKLIPCEDCGTTIQRKANPTRAQLCLECGTARAIALALQIKAREGPYYERWLAGVQRAADRRKARGGA